MSNALEVKKVDEVIQKGLAIPKLAPMKKVYEGVGLIVTKLAAIVIKNVEDYDRAMLAIKEAKAIKKQLKEAEDGILENAKGFVKSVVAVRGLIEGPIDLGLDDANQKATKFQNDQHAKRQKEAADLKLKADAEQAKLPTVDTAKEAVKIEAKVEKLDAKAEAILTYKPKTVDRVRKFEVVNAEEVERLYCSPDEKKIKPFIGEVDGPIPVIKGVKIWDTAKPVAR